MWRITWGLDDCEINIKIISMFVTLQLGVEDTNYQPTITQLFRFIRNMHEHPPLVGSTAQVEPGFTSLGFRA